MLAVLLIFSALNSLSFAGDDTLIHLSQKSSCIKDVVSMFVQDQSCSEMDESGKTRLAMMMTRCLMTQMGRALPKGCQTQDRFDRCKLEGDSWNTFSTFFAHIDNLCHFYWEMLHHQRAISSQQTSQTLKQNLKSTQEILNLQATISNHMRQSLKNHQKMEKFINSSETRLNALTSEVESFIQNIHQNIDEHYRSVRNVLMVMNEGIQKMGAMQGFLAAEVSSIQGMVYFFIVGFISMVITGLTRFKAQRTSVLLALGCNIACEIILGKWITVVISLKMIRYAFLSVITVILANSQSKKQENIEIILTNQLNTARLQKVFKNVLRQKNLRLYSELKRKEENEDVTFEE